MHNFPIITPIIMAGGDSQRMGIDKATLIWRKLPLICHMINIGRSFSDVVHIVTDKANSYQELLAQFDYDCTNHDWQSYHQNHSPRHTSVVNLSLNSSVESIKETEKPMINLHWIDDLQKAGPLVGFYIGLVAMQTARSYSQLSQDPQEFFIGDINIYPDSAPTPPSSQLSMTQTKPQGAHWFLLLSCDLPLLEASTLLRWKQTLAALPMDTIAYLPPVTSDVATKSSMQPLWHSLCGFYRSQCLLSLSRAVRAGERSFQRWLKGQVVAAIPNVEPIHLINSNTPEQWQWLLSQE